VPKKQEDISTWDVPLGWVFISGIGLIKSVFFLYIYGRRKTIAAIERDVLGLSFST